MEELGGVMPTDWFWAEIGVFNSAVILRCKMEYIHHVLRKYGVEGVVVESVLELVGLHLCSHVLDMKD
jgi:hypothetical protein